MASKALVTGGAGFIGSHIVDRLLAEGYEVLVYDSLIPQVHGPGQPRPAYLDPRALLVVADIRDREKLSEALSWADVVLHEASAVGVGQSMYDVFSYVEVNSLGTALLCELLARGNHRIKKVLVASSMSNYGEGRYRCAEHGPVAPRLRPLEQLKRREWELRCPLCSATLAPMPTDEEKPLQPTSVYATTKRDQEELVLNVCRAYGIPGVALRYFNVYGPRQALSNPYTGVAAIFSSRILNNQAPLIFEDGQQSRDFTHVLDVAQANWLALSSQAADGEVLNVGTGVQTSLVQLFSLLAECLQRPSLRPQLAQQFREGDIRHCYADISKIQRLLGYSPSMPLSRGVADLAAWAKQETPVDTSAHALAELQARKLVL
jgi:dTDP-L-rhamnose 4-epimerase